MPTEGNSFEYLFGGKAPIEPNAVTREAAAGLFETFTGFVNAGFTPTQAMQLIIAMIARA